MNLLKSRSRMHYFAGLVILCDLMVQCFIRVITGSYPDFDTYPEANVAANQSAYVPQSESSGSVPWTACPQGIKDFRCSSDATNQSCDATL